MPASAMLGFVFELVLNHGLTDEQRIIFLRLELLNQKLVILNRDMQKRYFPQRRLFRTLLQWKRTLAKS